MALAELTNSTRLFLVSESDERHHLLLRRSRDTSADWAYVLRYIQEDQHPLTGQRAPPISVGAGLIGDLGLQLMATWKARFRLHVCCNYKNSSGDEIANVNFFYNIAHVEASAYAH